MASRSSILQHVVRDGRRGWKQLAWTDVIYKVVSYVLLTPLVSILFRILLAASGSVVLADQDILFFFLRPVGWLCCIVVGGLGLGIVALEQSALLAVVCAKDGQQQITLTDALRFAGTSAWPVLQVTARMVGIALLAVAPFVAAAGIAYFSLLSEYDINYYLQVQPPVFLVALAIGGLLALALSAVLLHLFTGWFFALPLVLFEEVRPANALRESGARARGHRRTLLLWIVGWAFASTVLSAVATSAVIGVGHFIVPRATGSLPLLSVAVGVTLVLWAATNLAVNLLSTTSFAVILYNLYRHLACTSNDDIPRLNLRERTAEGVAFQLTRTRLLVACVVSVVAGTTVGAVAMETVRLEDNVVIMAHRGSSKAAPENTIAAVRQAIVDGADWIEIDVQETADGEVVVFHDSDFMKLAGVNLKIWDATTSDLKEIDVGSWFAAEFQEERVPTLGEVLDVCRGKAGVNIELKYYGHDEQLEQRVAGVVEAHGMVANVVIMSLKLDAVRKMKSLRPNWKIGLLMSLSAGNLRDSGADFLAVNATFANRRFVSSAQKRGQDVYVWTVNDAATMSSMISRGVDGLITDKPALARTVLAQRAEMSPLERLLIELAGMLGVSPEIAAA
ncbi:MAG: glycerophosphodiester phosphodiesterase family protein [Pirellulaceae bacterium]